MSIWGEFIFSPMYLLLPAYVANVSPVLFRNAFKKLAFPIDGYKTWRGKRLLGDNKTVRGFVVGIPLAIVMSFLQSWVINIQPFASWSLLSYNSPLLIGFLLGTGALVGDATKSFFKRQCDIKPGDRFIPFDQIDFVFGALIFLSFYTLVEAKIWILCILLSFILHVVVNQIGFRLHLKNTPW